MRRISFVVALVVLFATQGCRESPTTPPGFQPGPLGAVTLEAGEDVRIRMLLSATVAPSLGAVGRAGTEFAR